MSDSNMDIANHFTWALQELVTEYCWDSIWSHDSDGDAARPTGVAHVQALGTIALQQIK